MTACLQHRTRIAAVCGKPALLTTVGILVLNLAAAASAQPSRVPQQVPPRFYPQHANMPPGVNAHFAAMVRQPNAAELTYVKMVLPSVGRVEVFGFQPIRPLPLTNNWCGLSIGHVYRFRVTDLAEFPGIELYPTIEVLDRTHPPPGREAEFAVPLRLSVEEIEQAVNGQLVTKVVYVEAPQMASALPTSDGVVVETLPTDRNLIHEADLRGRAVAIIRLGARTPDPHRYEPEFWGSGGPVALPSGPQVMPESALPQRPYPPSSPFAPGASSQADPPAFAAPNLGPPPTTPFPEN